MVLRVNDFVMTVLQSQLGTINMTVVGVVVYNCMTPSMDDHLRRIKGSEIFQVLYEREKESVIIESC